jgi:3-hydroxy-3-methylglutaryl CoA synthase
MPGICTYGGYVPRYRLSRQQIHRHMGWLNPATAGLAAGEKAVANFDEDSITLAVAAGMDALIGIDRAAIEGLFLASTSMPYKERLNAGIVSAALGTSERIRAADFSGGLKAGTTALLSALEGVASRHLDRVMVCAADCRLGKPGSSQEMLFGDAAAALVVGEREVVAEFRGAYSTTYDFVDHYRGDAALFDRQWEERWIRDVGFGQLLPEALRGLLDRCALRMSDFAKVVYPCVYPAARKKLNKALGIAPEVDQSSLQAEIGDSGAAHPLVMLVAALERSRPGDRILLVGFGSGCDALCFEVTENITKLKARRGIAGSLARRANLGNYTKYLLWRGMLPGETGMRAEEQEPTRWNVLWRKRREVTGLWGSRCTGCGTVQYPPQRICVNPDCGLTDQTEPYPFADKIGRVASFTGDVLAASPNPPAVYGQVAFEGGGKYLFDVTDCELGEVETGMRVAMSFRRKYLDRKRGVSGYFWKAVPHEETA